MRIIFLREELLLILQSCATCHAIGDPVLVLINLLKIGDLNGGTFPNVVIQT